MKTYTLIIFCLVGLIAKSQREIPYDGSRPMVPEHSLDVVWFHPESSPGTVGQFEKLELGVNFSTKISADIKRFVKKWEGTRLNPFNPEEVDLYAEFWFYQEGKGWVGPIKKNGFYYQGFTRNERNWTRIKSDYNFRLRFAPKYIGLWRCRVSADVKDYGHMVFRDFTFSCVDSDSKDFVSVGENNRYFKMGSEPYFPVGHNLSWPRYSDYSEWALLYEIVPPKLFREYHNLMDTIKLRGGNYFRFIQAPWATEIEFEKLGDYSDRMRHAWEMDEILDHADMIDLKMHFNMQIHYTFEQPTHLSKIWDWTAFGDSLADLPCMPQDDKGYCYRSELGIMNPTEFFTNEEAKKHYKNRLRYMIARWGYSNEIVALELMSEINNAGKTAKIVEDVNKDGKTYCKKVKDPLFGKPYDLNEDEFCPIVFDWQNEMAEFVRLELEHKEHLIAVNYTSEPKPEKGDYSFISEYVDLATWNHYQVLVSKYADNYNVLKLRGLDSLNKTEESFLNKPMMHSEYGPGAGGVKDCDNNVSFIKTVLLSPFSGLAGSAMYWDWQRGGETEVWKYFKMVNDFMTGIKLDEENWKAQEPQVSKNKHAELMYLRNFVEDNYRVVGALSNRTYNYYTQATGSPCNLESNEIKENERYKIAHDLERKDIKNEFKLKKMGKNTEYHIEWINALTGEQVASDVIKTNIFGKLKLNLPENVKLTGGQSQPILYFRIYPITDTSFIQPTEIKAPGLDVLFKHIRPDTSLIHLEPSNWK